MVQPPDPPFRTIGYSYSYRTYVFQVSQGIALYRLKLALSQPRGEGGRGYRSSSCPQEGIALQYRLSRFNGPLSPGFFLRISIGLFRSFFVQRNLEKHSSIFADPLHGRPLWQSPIVVKRSRDGHTSQMGGGEMYLPISGGGLSERTCLTILFNPPKKGTRQGGRTLEQA